MLKLIRSGTRTLLRLVSVPLSVTSAGTEGPADAAVIMGGPINSDGSLPMRTEERVRTAIALWREGRTPVLCFVGGHCPPGFDDTEAEQFGPAAWALGGGVPEGAIRVDRESRDSWENALQAKRILGTENRRRVLVITQPFHLRRSCFLLRRQGFVPIPVVIADGVQEHSPIPVVLRWIVREYASWVWLAFRLVRSRLCWRY